MTILVSWGNPEKTIALATFGDSWTVEEAHQMIEDMYKLTTSVDHTVHTVLDFSNSRSSPTKLMSTGQHVQKRTVPNSGVSVVVGANSFLKAISQMIMKLFVKDQPFFFASTFEEAKRIIAQYEQAHSGNGR